MLVCTTIAYGIRAQTLLQQRVPFSFFKALLPQRGSLQYCRFPQEILGFLQAFLWLFLWGFITPPCTITASTLHPFQEFPSTADFKTSGETLHYHCRTGCRLETEVPTPQHTIPYSRIRGLSFSWHNTRVFQPDYFWRDIHIRFHLFLTLSTM